MKKMRLKVEYGESTIIICDKMISHPVRKDLVLCVVNGIDSTAYQYWNQVKSIEMITEEEEEKKN